MMPPSRTETDTAPFAPPTQAILRETLLPDERVTDEFFGPWHDEPTTFCWQGGVLQNTPRTALLALTTRRVLVVHAHQGVNGRGESRPWAHLDAQTYWSDVTQVEPTLPVGGHGYILRMEGSDWRPGPYVSFPANIAEGDRLRDIFGTVVGLVLKLKEGSPLWAIARETLEHLERLQALRVAGALTDQEFTAAKRQVLAGARL